MGQAESNSMETRPWFRMISTYNTTVKQNSVSSAPTDFGKKQGLFLCGEGFIVNSAL